MDILPALGGIGAAFGLSASAGLNAYIPLLVVAITARFTNLINLSEPYDLLTSWPVIGVLAVLLVIEMTVDKIPAVDTVNDMLQTFVRPAAGAVMFAANANVINDLNPVVALVAGILLAGSVHATKTAVRPAVTGTTAGIGNPIVSLIEDIVAFAASIAAIFLPLVIGVITVIFLIFALRLWLRRRRRNQTLSAT